MQTKHDLVREICKYLGISIEESWFSSGSTVTRNVLDAIRLKVEKENDFDIETNPLSEELRSVFIKFVRGFEDHYRALKSEEVLIKTKILAKGKIGIRIEHLSGKIVKQINISDFAQWLQFSATGDPEQLDSFNKLSLEEQALVMVIRNQHLNSIIQNRLIGILKGDINNALNSSGVLGSGNVSINLTANAPVTFNSNINTTLDIDIDLGNQIIIAFENKDSIELRKLLSAAANEENKKPGYIKKILSFGKETGKKIIISDLIEWLNNPENVKSWPSMLVTLLIKALEQ